MPFVIRYSGSLGNLRQTTIHTGEPGQNFKSLARYETTVMAAGSLPDTRRTGWQIGLRTTVAGFCHELDILVGLPVKRWDRFLPKRLGKECSRILARMEPPRLGPDDICAALRPAFDRRSPTTRPSMGPPRSYQSQRPSGVQPSPEGSRFRMALRPPTKPFVKLV